MISVPIMSVTMSPPKDHRLTVVVMVLFPYLTTDLSEARSGPPATTEIFVNFKGVAFSK